MKISNGLCLSIWLVLSMLPGFLLAQEDSAVVPMAEHTSAIVFPNGMYWEGTEKGTFAQLAVIFEYSHRLGIPALYEREGGQLPTQPGLNTDPEANMKSARMAYAMLRNMSAEQNVSERVVYYDVLAAGIPAGSEVDQKLRAYARGLGNRLNDQEGILIIIVGSNGLGGKEGKTWSLAHQRAVAAAQVLNSEMQGMPHEILTLAGVNGMYSNPVMDTQFEARDRYARVTSIVVPASSLQRYQQQQAHQQVHQQVQTQQPSYTYTPPVQPQRVQPNASPGFSYVQPAPPQPAQQPATSTRDYTRNQDQPFSQRTRAQVTPLTEPGKQITRTEPQTYAAGNNAWQTTPVATGQQPMVTTSPQPDRFIENEFGMAFVYIEPGSFMMGSPEDELRRDDDERLHHVTLTKGFYMQTTELTLRQWHEVTEGKPAHFENWGWDYPVENVSWLEVDTFIKQLNEKVGKPLYRLPTEAEWEYACRAGTTTAFYALDMKPGEKGENEPLGRYAWYFHNSDHRTHRVAQKEPNAWGLYDMHGNVWEWCADWQGSYPFDPIVDPRGPSVGNAKIRRGGSYTHFPAFARSANRSWHHYKERTPNLGFRLVRDVETSAPRRQPAMQPAPAAPGDPCEYRSTTNGQALVRKGIPDTRGEGTVYVERETPAMIMAGEPYQYKLHVYNNTACDLHRVTVTELLPDGFVLRSTDRQADRQSGDALVWEIQPMAAGTSETFVITGAATGSRELKHCGTVDYTLQTCSIVAVVKPELALTQESPDTALICGEIPLHFQVTNSGTGMAGEVVLSIKLPAGLQSADGARELQMQIGNLAEGTSRDVNLMVRAASEGTYRVIATATGKNGLQATTHRTITVNSPRLRLTHSARATQYAGRPVDYTVTLHNAGTAAAENVMLTGQIPDGMSFVKASEGGAASQSQVSWQIPKVAPNETVRVTYALQTHAVGTFSSRVTAVGHCADHVAAEARTTVEGIAAILLEVADERDPLEVGQIGTYRIVTTNQGSMASTNIRIRCELEDNLEFVSGGGATDPTAETRGNIIVFAPLETLEPNARAVWQVQVRAKTAGDVRFKTQLNSDQLERPVEETEATTLY